MVSETNSQRVYRDSPSSGSCLSRGRFSKQELNFFGGFSLKTFRFSPTELLQFCSQRGLCTTLTWIHQTCCWFLKTARSAKDSLRSLPAGIQQAAEAPFEGLCVMQHLWQKRGNSETGRSRGEKFASEIPCPQSSFPNNPLISIIAKVTKDYLG